MSHFISRIATIELPVSNLENSIDFYMNVIGVHLEYKGEREAMLSFGQRGVPTIYLVQTEEVIPVSFFDTHSKSARSFIDFYTPTLKDFYQWLKENKIEVGSLNVNEDGLGSFCFKDPDGHLLNACNMEHKGQ